jgi:hypothetical protein
MYPDGSYIWVKGRRYGDRVKGVGIERVEKAVVELVGVKR